MSRSGSARLERQGDDPGPHELHAVLLAASHAARAAVRRATTALGLTEGPIHAELRLKDGRTIETDHFAVRLRGHL